MANVITSFLIALGYDTEDLRRGEREINRSMDNVKSGAGVMGAALTSALVGLGKTAVDTANRVNELRLSTNTLRTSAEYVSDYGNAVKSLGGDAGVAASEIGRVETALSNLRNKGDASTFTELAYAGVNVNTLQRAESGGDFMKELARQFPGLSGEQQMMVQQTLGLSPASVDLLRKGETGFQNILNHVHNIAGLSDDLIEKSREYNAALADAQIRWQGIANTISEAVLPEMTTAIEKGSQILTDVIKPMAEENPIATGAGLSMTAGGVAAGVAAPLLGAVGMGGLGAVAGAAAAPVALAGLGTLAWNMDQKDVKNLTGQELPDWLFEKHTVFDESEGELAGGNIRKGSFLDKAWNMDQKGLEDLTGWKAPEWLFKPIGSDNDAPNKNNMSAPRLPSSSDSLSAGYEAEKQTYMNSSSYAPESTVNDYSSAAATGEAIAEKLYKIPLKAEVTNNVDMRVELDGRALDAKITDVQQRNNQMTVDDMQSTTAR